MATITSHDPHTHIANVEAAEKRFHGPATLLEVLSAIRRRCQAMEALFCSFLVDARLVYHPPMPPYHLHCTGGTGSAETCGWSKTTRVFPVF